MTDFQPGDEVIVRAFGDYRHGRLRGSNRTFTRYLVVEGMNGRLVSDLVTPADLRPFNADLWGRLECLQVQVDEANKKVRRWRAKQRKLCDIP